MKDAGRLATLVIGACALLLVACGSDDPRWPHNWPRAVTHVDTVDGHVCDVISDAPDGQGNCKRKICVDPVPPFGLHRMRVVVKYKDGSTRTFDPGQGVECVEIELCDSNGSNQATEATVEAGFINGSTGEGFGLRIPLRR